MAQYEGIKPYLIICLSQAQRTYRQPVQLSRPDSENFNFYFSNSFLLGILGFCYTTSQFCFITRRFFAHRTSVFSHATFFNQFSL